MTPSLRLASVSLCVVLTVGCGDDAQTGESGSSGMATSDSTASADDLTATSSPSGTTMPPEAMPCAEQLEEMACRDADPGNGQLCGWVPSWQVTTEGEGEELQCTFGQMSFLCVQQLGTDGGTPFGSCGGDGTAPVYYREVGGTLELVQTDGFFTPEGWSNCDCHDGAPDPDDPWACCCACAGMWPS